MVLYRSSTLVLFVSLVCTWISSCDNTLANAAPISQLLARQASSPSSPNPAPRPSPGRVQIKLVNTPPPPPSFRRSDRSSRFFRPRHDILASVPEPPSEAKVIDSWYTIERRRGHSLSLHGHAVLDDEDDDAGNELLDTELDGLLRPDEDDTIEGEAIEEEEDEDEQEDEDDIDAEAARVRAMYSLDYNHPNSRDASSLRALDEQEAEMLEEVQDQAEEEDEEEEDWLARGFRDSDLVPEDLEDDEEPEAEMPLPTMANTRFQVVVSRFGGKAAAADMAAGLD
ncbi:hypothetical protein BGZ82_010881 [Podila clonocystis]|nr:hypothetical protein BGZ82_010881 [Podila clonocystis]